MEPHTHEDKGDTKMVEVSPSPMECRARPAGSPEVAPQMRRDLLSPGKVTREPRRYRQAPFDITQRRPPEASTSIDRPRSPPATLGGPKIKPRDPWHSWSELTVKIFGVPNSTTTWDLWKRFETNGTVNFIELYETRQGNREGTAKIRFSPPPLRDFWSLGTTTIPAPDGRREVAVRIELEPKKRTFEVRSPIRPGVWYPEKMSSCPSAITFGFMYEETVMMNMRRVLDGWKNIKFEVDLLRSRLVVTFETTMMNRPALQPAPDDEEYPENRMRIFMFTIPFGQLQRIYRVELNETRWALLLSLDAPPQFFQKRGDTKASHSAEALTWSDADTWFRLTDIVEDSAALDKTPVGLRKENPFIDIGRWTTYYISFDKDRNTQRVITQMRMALSDYNIKVNRLSKFSMIPGRPAEVWPLIDTPPPNHDLPATPQLTAVAPLNDCVLPFEVRYQLEVCISQGVLHEHNISRDFVNNLAMMAKKDPAGARNLLEYAAQQETRIFDPMAIFSHAAARAHSPNSKIPDYCTYTRKLTVTPTTLYFSTPTVETTNRVIRKYMGRHGDRFLRVQFTDEKAYGRINSCADKARNDKIFARVWRTLSNGVQIGDRTYEFLAFGNSQFRENGAYFFCPTPQLKADNIRQWMGNFTDIKVVAKYAARLGLCFSTTRAIRNSGVKKVMIKDVEKNGYCFTDGVGKISVFLAEMIADELQLPPSNRSPSAFQFRLGGAKGVLVAWPEVQGREVHIRPSQDKFPSGSNGLEIIRCSHYSPATLNRQTITILSSLGVPDDVFNRMIGEQLVNYQAAMEDRVVALDCLGRYVDEHRMTITIASMIENGFMDAKEPFVLSLLHLWRAWSIKLLKEKARLIVENGAFLLGVTDETHTLRGQEIITTLPGAPVKVDELPEIFVQIPDKNKRGCYVVIVGLCLVGRNPSLFPGDIRVVKAVNNPSLHHLRDVIVFSQQGVRDVPSMCSGGDLDGDDFFCIWDKNLTPQEWNAVPMSYMAEKPVELDRPVRIDDVMKFFVRYMKNDTLPTIAQAHLAQSDFLDRGIKDPKCLQLAVLHSKAVDYVKTGDAAQMPRRLRPRMIPHFMDKNHRPREQIYKSEKILGQLYDRVDSVNFTPQFKSPFDERILKASPRDKAILGSVRQIKLKYDTAVRQIMNQLGINTEFEVWSTFVLSSKRVGSNYKLQEDMAVIASALKDRFRKICIEAAGADGETDFENLKPFVAAMYKVTEEEMRVALDECSVTKMTVSGEEVPKRRMEPKHMPLMSFPWLFDVILGKIAKKDFIVGLAYAGIPSSLAPSELKMANIEEFLNCGMPYDGIPSNAMLSGSKSANIADVPHAGLSSESTRPRTLERHVNKITPLDASRFHRPDSLGSEDEDELRGSGSFLAKEESRGGSTSGPETYLQEPDLIEFDEAAVAKHNPDEFSQKPAVLSESDDAEVTKPAFGEDSKLVKLQPYTEFDVSEPVFKSMADSREPTTAPPYANFDGSGVKFEPNLMDGGRANTTSSYSEVTDATSAAFSFANAGSSTMEDLAMLDVGPRMVSNPGRTANTSTKIDTLIDFVAKSSQELSEFGSDLQDPMEDDEGDEREEVVPQNPIEDDQHEEVELQDPIEDDEREKVVLYDPIKDDGEEEEVLLEDERESLLERLNRLATS